MSQLFISMGGNFFSLSLGLFGIRVSMNEIHNFRDALCTMLLGLESVAVHTLRVSFRYMTSY